MYFIFILSRNYSNLQQLVLGIVNNSTVGQLFDMGSSGLATWSRKLVADQVCHLMWPQASGGGPRRRDKGGDANPVSVALILRETVAQGLRGGSAVHPTLLARF